MKVGAATQLFAVVVLGIGVGVALAGVRRQSTSGTPVLRARIFLCTRLAADSVATGTVQPPTPMSTCIDGQATTKDQTTALSTALKSDDRIIKSTYTTEMENLALAKLQQPAIAPYLKPGDLPASFTIMVKAKEFAAVRASYAAMPGVNVVSVDAR